MEGTEILPAGSGLCNQPYLPERFTLSQLNHSMKERNKKEHKEGEVKNVELGSGTWATELMAQTGSAAGMWGAERVLDIRPIQSVCN